MIVTKDITIDHIFAMIICLISASAILVLGFMIFYESTTGSSAGLIRANKLRQLHQECLSDGHKKYFCDHIIYGDQQNGDVK